MDEDVQAVVDSTNLNVAINLCGRKLTLRVELKPIRSVVQNPTTAGNRFAFVRFLLILVFVG